MLKNIFSRFIILLFFVLVILFAFSNSDYISLGIWPLDKRIEIPIYFLVIFTLALGIFIGLFFRFFKKSN
tara:strand:+ start:14422 stop:14631 length:210 start_codon:yes stop_codon:yes gene_type:complete